MRFWVDWALWQKLSIAVVLVYSFGILIYNRRRTKKHAEEEESEKAEQESELHPIVTHSSEIPFGARALERGVQVEGIWISNNSTPVPSPHKPSTPVCAQSPNPSSDSLLKQAPMDVTSDDHKPSFAVPPPPTNSPEPPCSENPRIPQVKIEDPIVNNGPDRPCPTLSRVDQYPHLVATVCNGSPVADELDMHPAKRVRTSWMPRTPDKRRSAIERRKRQHSSEEFRRRISKLFDDNAQTPSVEALQLNPFHPASANDMRQSSFGPPPPV
ncbi:hypothetical protein PHISP_03911 [Aspergillus sp. HF37]|nr:hypothetical protein PHISP_03911 [Aspergillus sp. HF37]